MSTMVREIVTLQRQWREIGRIRMGAQVAAAGGKRRPTKLATFRVTSGSRDLVAAVAAEYGGKPQPWKNGDQAQHEVVIEAEALDILIPPGEVLQQAYELWTGGGCVRRCDGQFDAVGRKPCQCPSDGAERMELAAKGQACKPTSRLNVILPRVPDLGVWRLESHGYYAAVELAGTVDLLRVATARGIVLQARLRLEQRTVKRPGEPPKHFAVPVVELPTTTVGALLQASAPAGLALAAGQPPAPALGPGDADAPTHQPAVARTTPQAPSWGEETPLPETVAPIGGPIQPTPAAAGDVTAPAAASEAAGGNGQPDTATGTAAPSGPLPEGAADASIDFTAPSAGLAEALIQRAASGPATPATQQQRDALNVLLQPLGREPVIRVLLHVFEVDTAAAITSAMAEAILDEAELDAGVFKLRWANLAEQLRKAEAKA